MYGARYGSKGAQYGSAQGPSSDDEGASGYAPVAPGPGAVVLMGQSGAGGPALSSALVTFAGVEAPYANVQMSRRGATAGNPPTWVQEALQNLQPRTAAIGAGFPVGSMGLELQMGRTLDAASSGWSIIQMFIDGSGLEDHWINPAYPVSGGQLLDQAFAQIDTQCANLGTTVKAVVWFQGEADSGGSPDATNYYANLVTLFDRIRRRYGDVAIVLVRLSDNFGTDAQSQPIRMAQESFVANNPRARIVTGDELPFFDTAHYTADSNCVLGQRAANRILDVVNSVALPANPRWSAQGNRVVVNAGTQLGPLPWPTGHQAGDLGIIVVSATGANPFVTPSGWTEFPNSPQYGGVALDARVHAFYRRATSSSEASVTFANPASGDSKVGLIFTVRGVNPSGNPYDVTAGSTVSTTGSTVVTMPGVTTTVNDTLLVHILAHRTDLAVPQVSAWANAGLTDVTEQVDVDTLSGAGYGIAIATGVRAVAGVVAGTTATLATAVTQAKLTIALKP